MISADQLTLFQQSGTDYPHHITTAPPPGFSDLPTALTTFGTRETYLVPGKPIWYYVLLIVI